MVFDKRFVKVSLWDLETPSNSQKVLTDKWWVHKDGHVLGFKLYGPRSKDDPSPQCNDNKDVAERLTQKLYPGYDVIFVPVAYWPPRREAEGGE